MATCQPEAAEVGPCEISSFALNCCELSIIQIVSVYVHNNDAGVCLQHHFHFLISICVTISAILVVFCICKDLIFHLFDQGFI